MTITTGMMTSETSEWTTPQDLFDRCNKRWGPFTLDAAATHENHLVSSYMRKGPEGGALISDWFGRVWCNPPYGREIGKWVKRAHDQVEAGNAERVVMLLPARTDTRWWQRYIYSVTEMRPEVYFLKGRLKFGGGNGSKNSAPFPSAIVVFERPFE